MCPDSWHMQAETEAGVSTMCTLIVARDGTTETSGVQFWRGPERGTEHSDLTHRHVEEGYRLM